MSCDDGARAGYDLMDRLPHAWEFPQ